MILIGGLIAAAAFASAQDMGGDMGGYNSMQIDAGKFLGTIDGGMRIKEMTDGVKVKLMSDDPNVKPMPVRAYTMHFTWKDKATTPATIVMEGNVEVQHPQGTITSEKAVWDFEKGELVFTGNPVVNGDQVQGMRGERIVMNFKANTVEVQGMRADKIPLQQAGDQKPGEAADPSLLKEADVKDWKGLIQVLKGQSAGNAAAPGKQIVAMLPQDVRKQLVSAPVDMVLAKKGSMLSQLNKALKDPRLYNEAAFKGVALPEEAKALLGKGKLEGPEQTHLNRMLLEAAYPDIFGKK
jgi:hypothetical protein